MLNINLELPKLHENQKRVKNGAARFNVVDCGRRWGKTLLGEDLGIQTALDGDPVGWFSPVYKYATEAWRDLARALQPVITSASKVDLRMQLITGGIIEIWTLTNENAGRSRKYKRVIVDEAALVPDLMSTWNSAIRPTLMDMQGDAWFLSTPKGHNGFWKMYQWGIDTSVDEWACWKMPTSANPYIAKSEIDEAKRTLPERVYQQEIEADFIEDAGGVFRGVMGAATATEQTKPIDGHSYIFGVDWGKSNDFTVITVIDIHDNSMALFDRFNQIDYTVQVGRLKALAEKFRPSSIVVETNSMGGPLVELLEREGLPISPFTTTNATKAQIIDKLALAFERQEITILNDPLLVGELQAYEMERLPSGTFRYNAPSGIHDDTVMSLALAWHGSSNDNWWITF